MNNEQRGVALLIVLMLLALMAALAADMTLSFHSQLQRTRQVNHHLQRQYDIELAEKLALASLTQKHRGSLIFVAACRIFSSGMWDLVP